MGKKIVTISFLVFLLIALYVILTRDTSSIRRSAEHEASPLFVFEGFEGFRYKDDLMVSRFSGRTAKFYEPNLIEFEGDLRGAKYHDNGDTDTLRADTGKAMFESEKLTNMMKKSNLESAEAKGNVEVSVGFDTLYTVQAEYKAKEDLLTSKHPVTIKGVGRSFEGDAGFDYQVSKENLDVHGQIKGKVEAHLMNQKTKP